MENADNRRDLEEIACSSKLRNSLVAEESDKNVTLTQRDAIDEESSSDSNASDAANKSKKLQMSNKLLDVQQNGSNSIDFRLEDFSDEVLYEIFKHLDSWSILALMNSAARFVNLLLDKRFWHNIDLSHRPLPLGILEDVLVRSNEGTHSIKVCGPPSGQHVSGEFKRFTTTLTSIFPKLRTTLKVLELEGVSLDFSFIHITDFPASLNKLMLKDCSVKIPEDVKSIFHTMDTHLKDLDELGIEDCDWFEPYYIMAISKLPILRKLSLKGCKLLTKFVPYGSMAARFGFHKLEILDLRFTPINNADLQCFGAIGSLRQLLLDCPRSTPKGKEPGIEEQSFPSASKNTKIDLTNESLPERSEGRRLATIRLREASARHFTTGLSPFYRNAPPPSVRRFPGNAVDEDNIPSTSREHILRLPRKRNVDSASPSPAGRTVDYDNLPSTSSGVRSMYKRFCGQSPSENSAKRRCEDSDSDSDGDGDENTKTPKPASNGTEDEESFLSSPQNALPDSVKFIANCCETYDSDSDGGAAQERKADQGDYDDDNGDDDNETRSTVSFSDAARESSPNTSRSSTLSEASNQSVVVIRVNPSESNNPSALSAGTPAPVPRAEPSPHVCAHLRNPNAFLLTGQQDRTIEEVLRHMEQIRANLRSYNERRQSRHRPYHLICMNPQNPSEPLYLMQPQNQNQRTLSCQYRQGNHFEQVLGHPMFWNLMDPLNTQASRRHRYAPTTQVSSVQVTDRAMYSFGRAPNPVEPGVIWIRNNNRPHNNRLERIELRNYRQITDLTLQHLVQVSPNLTYIDVSGTGVTRAGVRAFQESMIACEVIASHITEEEGPPNDDNSETPSTSVASSATSTTPTVAEPAQEQRDNISSDDDDDESSHNSDQFDEILQLPIPVLPVNGEIINNILGELPVVADAAEVPPDEPNVES